MYGGFRLVHQGVTWLHEYPLIDTIAPAITQRSLEGLFLTLMAAVLFSVLIASIGTLYGSDDLELLLALPASPPRIFTMKVTELFINAAGMPLIFTLPVLAGVGVALGAHPLYYPVSVLAASALYALPVTLGALLALLLVRISPAGRVREVATAVSISVAAAALLGLRALRPEQLFTLSAADGEAFERFLTAFARLEIGWLPPAWATNTSWAALDGQLHPGFAALLAAGLGGLAFTGLLARLAYSRGWVRSLDTAPAPRARPARPAPLWERVLTARLGTVGAIITRDARVFFRDVQQWSQLLVLLALAGVYFVSLAAIPVPTQQFRDVLGTLNIAFVSFITAGVALRIAFPAVSYEGGTYWLTQVSPIRKRDLVLAKFLFTLPVMLVLSLALGLAARFLLDLSPILAVAAPLAALSSAVALTGLAVGIGAAHPHFQFTNPNELALTPGAFVFMVLAFAYSAVITLLLARPAWNAISQPGNSRYWSSPEGLLILAALAIVTLVTVIVPLVHGTRHLQRIGN
jgi:ABC-2 type transport system permease protein